MAASIAIEIESGVYTKRFHPHNGYYAGSFSRLVQAEPNSSHDDVDAAA
jgi:hypothetical protein